MQYVNSFHFLNLVTAIVNKSIFIYNFKAKSLLPLLYKWIAFVHLFSNKQRSIIADASVLHNYIVIDVKRLAWLEHWCRLHKLWRYIFSDINKATWIFESKCLLESSKDCFADRGVIKSGTGNLVGEANKQD